MMVCSRTRRIRALLFVIALVGWLSSLASSAPATTTKNNPTNGTSSSSSSSLSNGNNTSQQLSGDSAQLDQAPSPDSMHLPLYTRILATCACLLIFSVGLAGNFLVPLVVIKTKYLRNSTNLFLINLSMADLVLLIVSMPTVMIELHSQPETWLLGEPMCKISNFVEMFAANGSIFTILAISFERYYAICKPLEAGYKCTRLRATIIICLIWLLTTILTSPILIMAKSFQTVYIDGSLVYNCILETDTYWQKMYIFVSMFAFFCLPLIVLMIVYLLISRRLIRENLAMSTTTSLTANSDSITNADNNNTTTTTHHHNHNHNHKSSIGSVGAGHPAAAAETTTTRAHKPNNSTLAYLHANANSKANNSNQPTTMTTTTSSSSLASKGINKSNSFSRNLFTTLISTCCRQGQRYLSQSQTSGSSEQKVNDTNGSHLCEYALDGFNSTPPSMTKVQPKPTLDVNEKQHLHQHFRVTPSGKKLATKALSLDHHFIVNGNHLTRNPCHHDDCLRTNLERKVQFPRSPCDETNGLTSNGASGNEPNGASWLTFILDGIRDCFFTPTSSSSNQAAHLHIAGCPNAPLHHTSSKSNSNSSTLNGSSISGFIARLHSICEGHSSRDDVSPHDRGAQCSAFHHRQLDESNATNEPLSDERGSEVPFLRSSPSPSPPTLKVTPGGRMQDSGGQRKGERRKRRFFLEGKKKRDRSQTTKSSNCQSLRSDWGKRFSISTSSSTSIQTYTTTLHSGNSVSHDDHNSPSLSGTQVQVSQTPTCPFDSSPMRLKLNSDSCHNSIIEEQDIANHRKNTHFDASLAMEGDDEPDMAPHRYVSKNERTFHDSPRASARTSNENVSSSSCASSSTSSHSTNSCKSVTPDSMLLTPNENLNQLNSYSKCRENFSDERGFKEVRSEGFDMTNPTISQRCAKVEHRVDPLISKAEPERNHSASSGEEHGRSLKAPPKLTLTPSLVETNTCDILVNSDKQISGSNSEDNNNNNNNNTSVDNSRSNISEDGLQKKQLETIELDSSDGSNEKRVQGDQCKRIKLLGYSLDRHHRRIKAQTGMPENNQHSFHFNFKRACRRSGKQLMARHMNNTTSKTQQSELLVVQDSSKKQQMDARRQVVVMLAFVVACFFLLFFPYRVFTIWLILSTEDQVHALGMETYYNFTYFSRILIYLHSAINPIAYNLISTKFRRAFMSILLCRGSASRRHFTTEHRMNNRPTSSDTKKSLRQSVK